MSLLPMLQRRKQSEEAEAEAKAERNVRLRALRMQAASLASSVPLSQASGVNCNGQSKGERERWVIVLLVSGCAIQLGQ